MWGGEEDEAGRATEYVLSLASLMFCGHLFSFLCLCVPSPLRFFLISPLCFFYPYNLALPICSPCHRTLNTCCHHAFDENGLPTRTQRKPVLSEPAHHAAAQRNNHDSPVASSLRPRRSARESRRETPEGSDGRHSEGPEGLGRQQCCPYTPKLEELNSVVPDMEALFV